MLSDGSRILAQYYCVLVENPQNRCTTQYQVGRVTGIRSPHTIFVDGMLHHVRDLQLFVNSNTSTSDINSKSSNNEGRVFCTICQKKK